MRLIVVTKTKPADTILELYSAGHREFGENYVCFLAFSSWTFSFEIEIAWLWNMKICRFKNFWRNRTIPPYISEISWWNKFDLLWIEFLILSPKCCFQLIASCPDIRWHFIGHLQRNKVKKLLCINTSLVKLFVNLYFCDGVLNWKMNILLNT